MDVKDLIVIDASTVLAGPSVGMFFAELGARVIKIEHPLHGDVTRTWRLPAEPAEIPVSAYFSSVNYKKEYRKLDYSYEADRSEFLLLVQNADILLTNFKFGDARKFNFTDEILFKENPGLIHGKISGFGKDSDRVAYDLILQAESGFMSMNGTPESGPVKMPVALIDVLAAHQLKEGLLVALLERETTRKGKVVDVSLYDAAICSLVNQAANYLSQGHVAQRMGSLHPNIAPYGEMFVTKDEQLVTFAIGSDTHFSKLCSFLKCEELIHDERFSANRVRVVNRVELKELLQVNIGRVDSEELLAAMHSEHVPAGKIKSLDEVLNDPKARQMVLEEEIEGIPTRRIKSVAFQLN